MNDAAIESEKSVPSCHRRLVDEVRRTLEKRDLSTADKSEEESYTEPRHYVIQEEDGAYWMHESPLMETSLSMEIDLYEACVMLGVMSHTPFPPEDPRLVGSTTVIEGFGGSIDSIMASSKSDALDALDDLGISLDDIVEERMVAVSTVTPDANSFLSVAPIVEEEVVSVAGCQHKDPGHNLTQVFDMAANFWTGRMSVIGRDPHDDLPIDIPM